MSYVEGKDKNQILNEFYDAAQVGSQAHEQQKMGIIVRCTEDLEKAVSSLELSMEKNATSNENLARKVFWLNVVLTMATIAIAVAAILEISK